MVDAKTCLIEQDNDPTQLRSPSLGKLVRYLVDSGDHVNAGEQYAEIEVRPFISSLVCVRLLNVVVIGHEDVYAKESA